MEAKRSKDSTKLITTIESVVYILWLLAVSLALVLFDVIPVTPFIYSICGIAAYGTMRDTNRVWGSWLSFKLSMSVVMIAYAINPAVDWISAEGMSIVIALMSEVLAVCGMSWIVFKSTGKSDRPYASTLQDIARCRIGCRRVMVAELEVILLLTIWSIYAEQALSFEMVVISIECGVVCLLLIVADVICRVVLDSAERETATAMADAVDKILQGE